jgi:hypothetical protein
MKQLGWVCFMFVDRVEHKNYAIQQVGVICLLICFSYSIIVFLSPSPTIYLSFNHLILYISVLLSRPR